MSNSRSVFLDKVRFEFGAIREITRKQADEVSNKYNIPRAHWLFNDPDCRAGRGLYKLPGTKAAAKPAAMVAMAPKATVIEMVAPSVVSHDAEMSLVFTFTFLVVAHFSFTYLFSFLIFVSCC